MTNGHPLVKCLFTSIKLEGRNVRLNDKDKDYKPRQ